MRSDITLANESVDIGKVLDLMGFSYFGGSKLFCPFGDTSHSDGGDSKSFRIYADSNRAYCFTCLMVYTPVNLWSLYRDISYQEAAEFLLEQFGILRETIEDRWQDLTKDQGFEINESDLAESLRLYCARLDPEWASKQFNTKVARAFEQCLRLIPLITDESELEEWRTVTKKVMAHRLAHVDE